MRSTIVIPLCLAGCMLAACSPPGRITEPLRIEGSADTFVAWQGFTHAWTHNHRWNRFGNWVESRECDTGRCWGLVHAGASGSSSDTATFSSGYTEIEQAGVGFAQSEATLIVEELLGSETPLTFVDRHEISLSSLEPDVAANLRDREQYTAWFNGWDLLSVGDRAAKPIDFAMEVEPPVYDSEADTISVVWRAYLRMGCSTPECRPEDLAFKYRLQPRLAVLGYDADDGVAVYGPTQTEHNYEWDAPRNPLGHGKNPDATELEPAPVTARIAVDNPTADHVPVLTRVYLHLFHWADVPYVDLHMVEWRSLASTLGRTDSDIEVEMDLLFKQWVPGMTRYQAFAYPDVGAATMRADVSLLEFGQATKVVTGEWNGSHSWIAGDRSADTEAALTRSWDVEVAP